MNMKFTTPEIEFEVIESLDVIATSPEDEEQGTTVSPIDPSLKNDPYLDDKF